MLAPSDHLRPTINPGNSADSGQDSELRQELESIRSQLQLRDEQLQLQARYVSRLEHEIHQTREEKPERDKAFTDQAREVYWLRERLARLAAEKGAARRLWGLIASLRSMARRARRFWRPAGHDSSDVSTAMLVFDDDYYRRRYPEVRGNPLTDYLSTGWKAGRNPHPLFDTSFYLQSNLDVAASGINPLLHYLRLGGFEGRNPHPLFLSKWYLDTNPDVVASGTNPLYHFLRSGGPDGRDPHPWFDSSFYLERYPEVASAHINPLVHFVTVGAAELYDPNDQFVTSFYVKSNPDAAQPSANPLVHYLDVGRAAGLACRPSDGRAVAGDIGLLAKDQSDSDAAYERVKRLGRDAESKRLDAITKVDDQERCKPIMPGGSPLSFAEIVAPLVSIVALASSSDEATIQCLTAVHELTGAVTCEVMLVDDGSVEIGESIGRIRGLVRVPPNGKPGRAQAWNRAAARARGRYLIFLDGQTQVTPECLTRLMPVLENERVGAVGPKVVFPDGRLQEAGVAINADGTFVLIGANDNATLPRYNYDRDVEGLSGACVAIEAARFRELEGFSSDAADGTECIDLCLRIAERGWRVVCLSSATVIRSIALTSLPDSEDQTIGAGRISDGSVASHREQLDAFNKIRLIAFYLPQFHPIAENDLWWGPGFTEWRNVTRARPNFVGHDQPRQPADLGYYDLRLDEVYRKQVELAEAHGLSGFCFYFYRFGSRKLLDGPIERLLRPDAPSFPFCLAWANENWTRRWDGREQEVLISQVYSDDDDRAALADISRFFEHPGYLRINGRPLVLIYRIGLFPDIRRSVEIWRNEARRRGVGDIYLAAITSFEVTLSSELPVQAGFDAVVEFPPHNRKTQSRPYGHVLNKSFRGFTFDYEETALAYMAEQPNQLTAFRGATPGWDNTPRRQDEPNIFVASTPGAYRAWLEAMLRETKRQNFGDERLVFINAWNEWAEGAYLEPDLRWGHAYLEATRKAVNAFRTKNRS